MRFACVCSGIAGLGARIDYFLRRDIYRCRRLRLEAVARLGSGGRTTIVRVPFHTRYCRDLTHAKAFLFREIMVPEMHWRGTSIQKLLHLFDTLDRPLLSQEGLKRYW